VNSAVGYSLADITLIEVATPLAAAGTNYGGIRLDSSSNTPIQVELSTSKTTANGTNGAIGLMEQNVGASDFDVNESTLGGSIGVSLTGLSVANAGAANKAISSLDSALDQVNAMRATMGAMQNRLDRTVNNLSNVLANTEASRSRIMDTDYAVETTNLAKAQIIQQAATAMLAQANQQPQSVLALLQ
jgi:flagellin